MVLYALHPTLVATSSMIAVLAITTLFITFLFSLLSAVRSSKLNDILF